MSKSMLHTFRVAWARWETCTPLPPMTPTGTEEQSSLLQPHRTLRSVPLGFQHQMTHVLENKGTLHLQRRHWNIPSCFLNQHCWPAFYLFFSLLFCCSSITYVTRLSARIFQPKLSEQKTLSRKSVLTLFSTCMNSANMRRQLLPWAGASRHGPPAWNCDQRAAARALSSSPCQASGREGHGEAGGQVSGSHRNSHGAAALTSMRDGHLQGDMALEIIL